MRHSTRTRRPSHRTEGGWAPRTRDTSSTARRRPRCAGRAMGPGPTGSARAAERRPRGGGSRTRSRTGRRRGAASHISCRTSFPALSDYGDRFVPHSGQNLEVPGTSWPHFGHFLGGAGARDAPQFGQNLVPAGTFVPHFGHGAPEAAAAGAPPSGVPHEGQNRVPGGTRAPHLGHGCAGLARTCRTSDRSSRTRSPDQPPGLHRPRRARRRSRWGSRRRWSSPDPPGTGGSSPLERPSPSACSPPFGHRPAG